MAVASRVFGPMPATVHARLSVTTAAAHIVAANRPGIVTDSVTSTCPARVGDTPLSVKHLSDAPLGPLDGRRAGHADLRVGPACGTQPPAWTRSEPTRTWPSRSIPTASHPSAQRLRQGGGQRGGRGGAGVRAGGASLHARGCCRLPRRDRPAGHQDGAIAVRPTWSGSSTSRRGSPRPGRRDPAEAGCPKPLSARRARYLQCPPRQARTAPHHPHRDGPGLPSCRTE
jgi:hypothetical protein